MLFEEYIKGAIRTESTLSPLGKSVVALGLTNRMYHGILGLATEIGEIVEAYEKENLDIINIAEELGDAFWYTAILVDELSIDPKSLEKFSVVRIDISKLPTTLCIQTAEMLDKTKKTMFYGKEYNVELLKEQVVRMYNTLHLCSNGINHQINTSMSKILTNNLNKLKIRYPEKFNLTDSEIKDLNRERKELEK